MIENAIARDSLLCRADLPGEGRFAQDRPETEPEAEKEG